MPIEERILGFTNRWYRAAMDPAQETELQADLRIRVVTAPRSTLESKIRSLKIGKNRFKSPSDE